MDLYELLGVAKNATKDEIKKKYREMAKKYHPDRFVNASKDEKEKAENMFKDINNAYETLIDDDRRAEYDGKSGSTNDDFFNGKGKKKKNEGNYQESYEDIYNMFSKGNMDEMFNDFMKKGTTSKEDKGNSEMKEGVNNMFESFFSVRGKGKGKK
ncbi:J domain-containing protein [Fusobacterium sp. PH5-44]|uniref:J domain-containing protein n=1 Tax=unclassified Fusobacterium TaxID=2648384 RepID=UPI003D19E65D